MINRAKHLLLRYHLILVYLVILGLIGYTLLRMQSISNPQLDQAYIASKNQANLPSRIQIKDNVRQEIEQLHHTRVNISPTNVGKPNPFSP